MDIKEIKLDKIRQYEKNQKKHPETQVKNIATSIEKYGFVQPLVLSKDNEIIIGHGRFLAAQSIGMENVPCVYADNLSEDQIKELRIMDNKLNESDWDFELLKEELDGLDLGDFDIDFEIPMSEDAEDDYDVSEDGTYTQKTEIPQYEVTGEVPKLNECIEIDKYNELVEKINASEVSKEQKEFLLYAAARHLAFDYGKVAEYYAAASKEMQELMEESALVIIDFEDAIKNGYVVLNKRIQEMIENGKE